MIPRKRLTILLLLPVLAFAMLLSARTLYWWKVLPTSQSVCQRSFPAPASSDSTQTCFAWSKEINHAVRSSPHWYGTMANQWRNLFLPTQSGIFRRALIRQLDTALLATAMKGKYSDSVALHLFISLYLHPTPEDVCNTILGHDCDNTSPEEATLIALWIRSPNRLLHSDAPLSLLLETTRAYFPQEGSAYNAPTYTLKFVKVDIAGKKADIPIMRSTIESAAQKPVE